LRSRDDLHGGRDLSSSRYDDTIEPDTEPPGARSPEVTDPGCERG
jgi:hypothetical protein